MKPELMYDLMNRALQEEIGLAVECNNPEYMRKIIHENIKDLDKYTSLIVCLPSLPNHVFLTKRSVDLDEVVL